MGRLPRFLVESLSIAVSVLIYFVTMRHFNRADSDAERRSSAGTGLAMPRKRVALLIESSRGYGRGLLQGVAHYARTQAAWAISTEPRAPRDPIPRWLADWRGDAVIARIETRAMAEHLLALRVPVVDLRGLNFDPAIPLIETDERSVTQLAFDHLVDRGFHRFAYVGFFDHNYSERRCELFQRLAADDGSDCFVYETPPALRKASSWEQVTHGLVSSDYLRGCLQQLPKPIGLMACNDVRGQQVLNACREVGVAVPEDIAVVGVDDDEVLCELSDPPLSSVAPDVFRIGYEAAALADQLMAGDAPPTGPTFIEARGVVTRQSTDVTAIDDRNIAAAVRFIRDHACDGIGVDDVVDAVPLSRSTGQTSA